MKSFVAGLLTALTATFLADCDAADQAPAAPQAAERFSQRWISNFDSRRWQIGHQAASRDLVKREYVLSGQTVHNWTELVSSTYRRGDVAPKEWVEEFRQGLARDCPSLRFSVIDESTDNIVIEWQHDGCQSYPPQHEIRRFSRGRDGTLTLAYVEKTRQLAPEKRSAWISIIRAATIESVRSLFRHELGPVPRNEASEYLETKFSAFAADPVQKLTHYYVVLRAKPTLPRGAILVVQFENPEDPNSPIEHGMVWPEGKAEAVVESPEIKGIKCWNYLVAVTVYRDDTKTEKLGTHWQTVQSGFNVEGIDSSFETKRDVAIRVQRGDLCP